MRCVCGGLAGTLLTPRAPASTSPSQLLTEASGFVTIVCGTFLLHTTKDVEVPSGTFMQLLTRGGGSGGSSNGVSALGLSSTRLAAAAAEGGDGLELGVAPPPKAAQRRGASQR